MKTTWICLASSVSLSACMSMSGYDANNSFGCKAPDGVLCESMSGIYANAEQNNLPGQRVRHGNDETSAADVVAAQENAVLTRPLNSGTPIRSAPRVLRVWFAPWEDTDGDLHDQGYVYLAVDAGHWLVEHNRRRIQHSYQPIHAPSKTPVASSGTSAPASTARAVSDQGVAPIGVVQNSPSLQEASAFMGGIQTPSQINQQ